MGSLFATGSPRPRTRHSELFDVSPEILARRRTIESCRELWDPISPYIPFRYFAEPRDRRMSRRCDILPKNPCGEDTAAGEAAL